MNPLIRLIQACLPKGRLMVRVRQEKTLAGMSASTVKITGPTPGTKPTNAPGIAEFTGLDPGTYQVEVTLSAADLGRKFKLVPYTKDIGVSRNAQSTLDVYARPPSTLKVRVIARWPAKRGVVKEEPIGNVKFTVKGPQELKGSTAADGTKTFPGIDSGTYNGTAENTGGHDDKYTLPKPASVDLPAGDTKELLMVASVLAKLRVVIFGDDGKPISGAKWTLESPVAGHGTTGGNGLIEVKALPLARGTGKLKVTLPKPPDPPKAPPGKPPVTPPASDIPPYPPPIKADDFKDVALVNEPVAGEVEWSLGIGLLDDYTDDAGTKIRLDNMGFPCVGLADGPKLTRIVKAYQRVHMAQKNGSGLLSDVKGHATSLHDNL